jgi:hypothetical protein
MLTLTRDQKNRFWRDSVMVVEDAATPSELELPEVRTGTSFFAQQANMGL